MSIFKRKATWGEALLGKKEHKRQMRRVKQAEKRGLTILEIIWKYPLQALRGFLRFIKELINKGVA